MWVFVENQFVFCFVLLNLLYFHWGRHINIDIALVFVALTGGLGYVRAGFLGLIRIPVNHPLVGSA